MSAIKWIILAWLALTLLVNIARTGKEHVHTPGGTVFAAIELGLVAWLVVIV